MYRLKRISRSILLTAVLLAAVIIDTAWAGESGFFTRHTFDVIMRWINFIILAVVLIKYGRKPIANFIAGRKKAVARSIDRLEEQKQQVENEIRQSQTQLAESEAWLEKLKSKIIDEGQNRRDQLIREAKNDARIMMEAAKHRIEGQIQSAYMRMKGELVDMAADLAISKLPTVMTSDDQEQWIHRWFEFNQTAPASED